MVGEVVEVCRYVIKKTSPITSKKQELAILFQRPTCLRLNSGMLPNYLLLIYTDVKSRWHAYSHNQFSAFE